MKMSKRNQAREAAKAEKLANGPPKVSKFAAKRMRELADHPPTQPREVNQ
jgi:hypothetical protein